MKPCAGLWALGSDMRLFRYRYKSSFKEQNERRHRKIYPEPVLWLFWLLSVRSKISLSRVLESFSKLSSLQGVVFSFACIK